MSQITLTSPDDASFQRLVESALSDKARVLQLAIRQSEATLTAYEEEHGRSTQEFIAAFEQNQLDHSGLFDDWYGEYQLLSRLRNKLTRLQRIQIAD